MNGAVYFSLGSNVLSSNLDNKTLDAIVAALKSLPYNVLWKFEADILQKKPKNVLTRKWFPQKDILGKFILIPEQQNIFFFILEDHSNIKAFVTQGGIHSVEEAILAGVPMIGIPFMSDQPKNIMSLVRRGAAIRLNFKELTKQSLREAIIEIATNQR